MLHVRRSSVCTRLTLWSATHRVERIFFPRTCLGGDNKIEKVFRKFKLEAHLFFEKTNNNKRNLFYCELKSHVKNS